MDLMETICVILAVALVIVIILLAASKKARGAACKVLGCQENFSSAWVTMANTAGPAGKYSYSKST